MSTVTNTKLCITIKKCPKIIRAEPVLVNTVGTTVLPNNELTAQQNYKIKQLP